VRPASEWATNWHRGIPGYAGMEEWVAGIQADAYAQAIEDAAAYVKSWGFRDGEPSAR
jgi:hypothetical protein